MTVAVLIPTYNRPRWLRLALESIRDQTYADWHCYVADDGSDQPVAIPTDPRFTLVMGGRRGHAATRNLLLDVWRESGHPLACWQDDDDLAAPTRLEAQAAAIVAQDVDLVTCDLQLFEGDKPRGGPVWSVDPSAHDLDITGPGWRDNLNHATAMMRRSVLDCDGYDVRFTDMGCDLLWTFSLFCRGLRFGHVAQTLYHYRVHGTNQSDPRNRRQLPHFAESQARLIAAAREMADAHV